MMNYDIVTDQFTLHFPEDWDERAEFERPSKGYLGGAVVETTDGSRFPVFFYEPVRLQQELDMEIAGGRPFVSEPGMIVVSRVTRDTIEKAVDSLVRNGFFSQKPNAIVCLRDVGLAKPTRYRD